MSPKLTPENYKREIFWVKLGRKIAVGLAALATMLALAGPAVGWYVDTRIYPGLPDETVQVFDAQGKVVDEYVNNEDTYSTTLWLYMPYSIYAGFLLVAGSIVIGVRVRDAREALGMHSTFDTLPPDPSYKLMLEAENATINQEERAWRKSSGEGEPVVYDPTVYTGEVVDPIPWMRESK
jgi:hypothetical protein